MKRGKVLAFVMAFLALFVFTNTVSAAEVDITSAMSQDEINASISSGDVVTVAAGDYATTVDGLNYHKYIVADGITITVRLNGNYDRLQLITKNNGTIHIIVTGNTTLNGEASTVFNPAAALAIQSGLMDINTNGNTLTITDYNNGVKLGNHITATRTESASLTLLENAKVTITNSNGLKGITANDRDKAYYDCYNDFGDPGVAYGWGDAGNFVRPEGNTGSAIYTRGLNATHYITLEKDSNLDLSGNDGSGIYVGYNNDGANNVYINLTSATLTGDNNGYVGLFEDGDNTGNYHLTATYSKISFSNNSSNGMTGHASSEITLTDSKLTVSNNGGLGINNSRIILNSSTLTGNDNGSHGISNIALDATDSIIETNNNGYTGLNISKYNYEKDSTNIVNSTINANGNNTSGIRFYVDGGITNITNSTLIANGNGSGNGDAGVLLKGDVYVINSTVISNSKNGYSLYDNSTSEAIFHVLENTVAVGNGNETNHDIYDDYNSGKGNSGNTVVTGGSLQVDIEDTMGSESLFNRYYGEINPVMPNSQGTKEEVQFTGPVNSDYTALTQFILHQNINKEVGGEGSHTFIYYDPNTGRVYNYTFRYNALGEDLDPTVSGNAYVWTPVSIINYDATEGLINNLGTAGKVSLGYGYTDILTGLNTRFASDITIFGNSLNLAEKVMPTATKENYVFLGWYIPEYKNADIAAELAARGEFDALYELLVIPFTESTKVLSDFSDLSSGLEEITIYAKWAEAGEVVVNYVDEEGNKLADEEIISGAVGEEYETSAKEFEGYYLERVEGYETGEIIAGTIYVTYVYVPYGIGDVEDPEEPTDEPVDEPEIIPPHTDATSVNVVYPISPIVVIDNKKKYLQNI